MSKDRRDQFEEPVVLIQKSITPNKELAQKVIKAAQQTVTEALERLENPPQDQPGEAAVAEPDQSEQAAVAEPDQSEQAGRGWCVCASELSDKDVEYIAILRLSASTLQYALCVGDCARRGN